MTVSRLVGCIVLSRGYIADSTGSVEGWSSRLPGISRVYNADRQVSRDGAKAVSHGTAATHKKGPSAARLEHVQTFGSQRSTTSSGRKAARHILPITVLSGPRTAAASVCSPSLWTYDSRCLKETHAATGVNTLDADAWHGVSPERTCRGYGGHAW